MEAALKNKKAFLNLFNKVVDGHRLDDHKKSNVNLFVLKMNANDFIYDELSRILQTSAIEYALSRKSMAAITRDFGVGTLASEGRKLFVPNYEVSGELGEMLLFCFLEADLGAPKILSKLELKTSGGMHVHGSDGVHLLKIPSTDSYQIIFGESKMKKEIRDGISEAVKSVADFKNEAGPGGKPKSGIGNEKRLVNAELEKEIFTEEDLEFVRKLIYPSRAPDDVIADDAFALFIGFEIDVTAEDKGLGNDEFRALIQKRVEDMVRNQLAHLVAQIKSQDLTGHHFYVYFLPFTKIHESKVEILKGALT